MEKKFSAAGHLLPIEKLGMCWSAGFSHSFWWAFVALSQVFGNIPESQ